jgi:predicted nucleic acid-binding protein
MGKNGQGKTYIVANIFIDTNVLVYSEDESNVVKQHIAKALIEQIVENHTPVISTQVLQEFYNASIKKLHIDETLAKDIVIDFFNMEVIQITTGLIEQGIDISILSRISFWDGLIIAAAVNAECSIVYSEDLNHGQIIRGVEIINPFKMY